MIAMSRLEWTPMYSVKIERFDEQHKVLIRYINLLHENIREKKEKSSLTAILDNLFEYTRSHFLEEEELMKKLDYPGRESHQKEHKKLINELQMIKERLIQQGNLLNVQLLYILKDWLINHIMKTDSNYTEFFHKNGVY